MPENFPVLSPDNHCSYKGRAGRTPVATVSSRSCCSGTNGIWKLWDRRIWIYVPGLFPKTLPCGYW